MRVSNSNRRVIFALISTALIIGALHQLKPHASTAPDFLCTSESTGSVLIDVAQGATGSSIAIQLQKKGVTQSSQAFFRIAVSDSRSARIAPGIHSIDTHICAKHALDQLLDNSRISNLLKIVEGAWNREIASELISLGFSTKEVSKAFSTIKLPEGFSTSEGLLYPALYSFESSTSVSEILQKIVRRGIIEMKEAGIYEASKEFSAAQLLTIASLLQAEGDVKDYSKISRVVRNRLKKGMPLQFDSTVHYVKGTRGSVFLSTQSTLVNSPYNTYKRYGLPPTPINNPGSEAMKAALTPEMGDWLYFITVAPGDTRFTDSLNQFNTWKLLYKKNLRNGLFD